MIDILKILSNKSLKFNITSLKAIYFSLSRSILDYHSIIFPLICETNKQKIRAIQYHALRVIYQKPLLHSHTGLLAEANVLSIDGRMNDLNNRYLENCFLFENELVISLMRQYMNSFPISRSIKSPTIFCFFRETLHKYLTI